MSEDLTGIWNVGSAQEVERLLHRIPYARFLGLGAEVEDDGLIIGMRASDRLVGNPVLKAVHGGAIGALLESAAIFGAMWESKLTRVPKTISFTVDYLRSARIVDTRARARITKLGRRVANVSVQAWQADPDKPIAAARVHLLLDHSED